MTTEEIKQVLRDAVKPINESVKELSGAFGRFQIETVTHLTEIRGDLRHVCKGHEDLVADVKDLREQQPLISAHIEREENTAAIKLAAASSKKSDPNMPRPSRLPASMRLPVSAVLFKAAPLILAAAIGLVGLGFFLASGNSGDAVSVMREIRALADRTTQLSAEMAKVQTAIEDGGVR